MSSNAFQSGNPVKTTARHAAHALAGRMQLPVAAMLVATALLGSVPTAMAQDGAEAASSGATTANPVRKQLDDFIHYVLIGKADLAQTAGEGVLGSGMSDTDLAKLVDEEELDERLTKAFARSRVMGGVSDISTKLEKRVSDGRRELIRDPKRISDAIAMLSKSLRERRLGEERLVAAGEYAVPQLLKPIVDGTNAQAEALATQRILAIGGKAAMPLSMSLSNMAPDAQRRVVGILADIGWPTAVPFIAEIANDPDASTEVKVACAVALERLGGGDATVSAQFTALARRFFDRQQSLVAYPEDAQNNLWHFDGTQGNFGGLTGTPVATGVFCDVMAMAMARRALAADASNGDALAIYIASDLRRENTLGSDAPASRYTPQFFATLAGPSVCSSVLALALEVRDTALVRDAIEVLSQTAGSDAMTSVSGRPPMIDALLYGDRRVRLDAALALASSDPAHSFPGDHIVVPTLASAIGDTGATRAAILGGSAEDRQAIAQQLSAVGIQTVADGNTFDQLEMDLVRAKGVELVVVRGSIDLVRAGVVRVRASGVTAPSAVLVIANALEKAAAERAFEGDRGVRVWAEAGAAGEFAATAQQIVSAVSGDALDESELKVYAARATEALKSIAMRGVGPLRAQDAQPVLLQSMRDMNDGLRMSIAEVLSIIASPEGQKVLVDAALAASGDDQIQLCDLAAAAARRCGAAADEAQLSELRALISVSEGATADAAGRLYGALDAGSAEAVKFITAE